MEGAQPRRENLEKKLRRARRHEDKKRIAEIEADLALPPLPRLMGYIWRIFHRIRRRVPMGFAGPDPITWPDIDSFVQRTGIDLLPWECTLIETLDDLYLAASSGKAKTEQQPTGKGIKTMVSITDSEGIKNLMGSIGTRKVVRRRKGKADG